MGKTKHEADEALAAAAAAAVPFGGSIRKAIEMLAVLIGAVQRLQSVCLPPNGGVTPVGTELAHIEAALVAVADELRDIEAAS
jgi:hypothetical protein